MCDSSYPLGETLVADTTNSISSAYTRRTARILTDLSKHTSGLRSDILLYANVLYELGYTHVYHVGLDRRVTPERLHRVWLNIFLEHIDARYLPLARYNWYMINQEIPHAREHYRCIDLVLCKSHFAQRLMQDYLAALALQAKLPCKNPVHGKSPDHTPATVYTSHSSRTYPVAPKKWMQVVHAAGQSMNKNTLAVLDAWERHPEYPTLHVISRRPLNMLLYRRGQKKYKNIKIHRKWIDDDVMEDLQTRSGLHVCTSEAEGWGHYLNEARACGAVIITTDLPPMNELVDATSGILVRPARVTERSMLGRGLEGSLAGKLHHEQVEEAMTRYLAMTDDRRREMGERARYMYERDRQVWRRTMTQLVRTLDV